MRMYDIIKNKRDNKELTFEELEYFVKGYVSGTVPDYQVSALLMAIYFNGLNDRETVDLTMLMRDSGDKADLSVFKDTSVDKHSTGGVGDKTTLIVAPIVASLGCTVAKMSGRGLGYTGGTVDKLESISGYKTALSTKEFLEIAEKCGISVVGQTGNFAPADKKIYSLRDVTATVDSIGLIASSIMSKKLVAGAKTIVLDVKFGSGAFMKDTAEATKLAETMIKIGKNCGKKVSALITDMNTPIGRNIGNSLEVKEVVETLLGNGPEDLKEICLKLSASIVSLSKGIDFNTALKKCEEVLNNKTAYNKFVEWISLQGGNTSEIENPESFDNAKYTFSVTAERDGYISKADANIIGRVSSELGAGRSKIGDEIDFSAGVVLKKTLGDFVNKGEEIAVLHSSVVSDFTTEKELFVSAFEFSDKKPKIGQLVYKIMN